MTRRSVVAVVTLCLIFAGGSAEASPVTRTTTEQGVVETFTDVVPTCEGGGPRYLITMTANIVRHVTRFADGRRHLVFVETGTFSAVPKFDESLPSYTGKFSSDGGFNSNGSSFIGTFTFNVRGTGSDGSTFTNHSVEHFNGNPSGAEKEFFKCH